MIMERFNVKETNPICIYIANKRAELIEKVTGAPPFMDEEMRALADRTLISSVQWVTPSSRRRILISQTRENNHKHRNVGRDCHSWPPRSVFSYSHIR
jgi:hypothetical protein